MPPLTNAQRDLAALNIDLVDHVARAMAHNVPPFIALDDLRSAGHVGLMRAARLFDPAKGFKFNTYATRCITGSILDELRSRLFVKRSAFKKGTREPEFASLSQSISTSERGTNYASSIPDTREQPGELDRQRDAVRHLTRGLPEHWRKLFERVYVDGIELREFAEEMGWKQSNTSRIHSRGIEHMMRAGE